MTPITIGIPFYNAEPFLSDAIRSVFAQTYEDWELILVDDGSTDRSLEIAHAVHDPRVQVRSDGQNKGLPFRLNQITALADSEFVARMDADDLMSPSRFQKQMAILEQHSDIDLVTTGVCSITRAKYPVGTRGGDPAEVITGRSLLLGRNAVVHAAILGRRTWFLRNPYDETVNRAEDHELWLRAYGRGDFRLYIMREPLYFYREEENLQPERQLAAYASQRALYRQYAHLGLHSIELAVVIAKSFAKSMVVRALSAVGKMDILLKRRNRPIANRAMLDDYLRDIQCVLGTRVPGLD
ncbi:MAG TPA: glycosyltransferase family 2 protein [Bacteroidota bacterium]|nr:glycosyltransferase family 2 protein [Bacteroidota bacterium]